MSPMIGKSFLFSICAFRIISIQTSSTCLIFASVMNALTFSQDRSFIIVRRYFLMIQWVSASHLFFASLFVCLFPSFFLTFVLSYLHSCSPHLSSASLPKRPHSHHVPYFSYILMHNCCYFMYLISLQYQRVYALESYCTINSSSHELHQLNIL